MRLHAEMVEFMEREMTRVILHEPPPVLPERLGSRLSALMYIEMIKQKALEDWQRLCELYATPIPSKPRRYSGNARDRRRQRRANLRGLGLL